jgi:N-acylneuraminate cytidylyltransferase
MIDLVVVTTDYAAIANEARAAGAMVVERPTEIAGDTATSESAVLHALDELDRAGTPADTVAFVQCTSPFISPGDLDAAVSRVRGGYADVVFSAVETYEFLWRATDDGSVGVNHDHSFRPRRQDRDPHYRETGAFYVMRASGFVANEFRFFGRVEHHVVPDSHAIEIDNPAELEIANALALTARPSVAVDVDALVTDFDGVHTDDRAFVDENGNESVSVSRSDGMGIALLRKQGLPILILSTERNPVVAARAAKLGVDVLQGVDDKATALKAWLDERKIAPARTAYVGNDINDLACLELVGWPVVVPNVPSVVRQAARVVLARDGGNGAVRELCDMILDSKGNDL